MPTRFSKKRRKTYNDCMQEKIERIPLEGTINTRDLGGYETVDHRYIQKKRIIRTDALTHITAKDIQILKDVYHIRHDVDFRSQDEINRKPEIKIPGVIYDHFPVEGSLDDELKESPHPDYHTKSKALNGSISYLFKISETGDAVTGMQIVYPKFVDREIGKKAYSNFFHVLIENKEGSVFYHCADGKDRAGVATVLVLLALGVDREKAIEDYLASNNFTKEKQDRREALLKEASIEDPKLVQSVRALAGVNRAWIEAALDVIDHKYGGFDSYWEKELHLTKEDRVELKKNYLIG